MIDLDKLTLQELKELYHHVGQKIKIKEQQIKEQGILFLVEKDGYWYITTPLLPNGTRKATKLCKRLSNSELVRQSMLPSPPVDDPAYKTWLKFKACASATRTLELCLTAEGERELQKLEKKGYRIELP